MYTLDEAIEALRPGASWIQYGTEYSGLRWLDETQTKPTEEEVVQKVAELTYQQEVEVYKEQRAREYPPYADQLDKIFHEGIDAWKVDIQAIKDRYPKQTMDADELERRKQQAVSDLENA